MLLYKKIHWTSHAEQKIRQYGFSKSKLLRILAKPERKEEGIAPDTTAVMQTKKVHVNSKGINSKKAVSINDTRQRKPPGEIWILYQDVKIGVSKTLTRKIISAWLYPGISKPGDSIPIPQDILEELSG